MIEFTDTFNENYDIKLSSAGLIYKYYGKEIISNVAKNILDSTALTVDIQLSE
jgi:uncharacterized UPF0160 family protein